MRRMSKIAAGSMLMLLGAASLLHAQQDEIQCVSLIYGTGKRALCYSERFLEQMAKQAELPVAQTLPQMKMEDAALHEAPLAIMSGEGSFTLFDDQRENLRTYLKQGGFVFASAGCSSRTWDASFRDEMAKVFPNHELKALPTDHAVYNLIYDVYPLAEKEPAQPLPALYALEIDGRIALIYSAHGMNDTRHAPTICCCCGSYEFRGAMEMNVNILVFGWIQSQP